MSTKGPWIVDGNGLDRSWNISGDVSICDVRTSREDALLISKAPEMLEALTLIKNFKGNYVGLDIRQALEESTFIIKQMRLIASIAIAKTEGSES